MRSQYWSGTQDGPSNAAVNYACVNQGGRAFLAAEALAQQVITAPGAISALRFRLGAAPGAGKSWTFKLRKNGADTLLAVTISDAATTGVDLAHAITVAAGDVLSISSTSSGAPTTNPETQWNACFDGDNNAECPLLSCGYTGTMQAAGQVNQLYPSGNAASIVGATARQQIVTVAGTITRFIARVPAAMGVGTWTITLQKNSVDTAMTGAITGQSVTVNGAIAVAAGDLITYKIVGSGSPVAQAISIGTTFKADVDGWSMILGGSGTNPANSAAGHNHVTGGNDLANSSADNRAGLASSCEVRRIYIQAVVSPVGGDSWTVDYIKNVNGTVAFGHITTDGAVQNPGPFAVAIADGDWLAVRVTPAGTPAASQLRWSIAIFSPPATLTTTESGEASALAGSTGFIGPVQTTEGGLTTAGVGITGYAGTAQTNSGGLATLGFGSTGYDGAAQTDSAGLTTDGVGTVGAAGVTGAMETNEAGEGSALVGAVGSPPVIETPPSAIGGGGLSGWRRRQFLDEIEEPPEAITGTCVTDSAGITTRGIGKVGFAPKRPVADLDGPDTPAPQSKRLSPAARRKIARIKRRSRTRPEPIFGVMSTFSGPNEVEAKGCVSLGDSEVEALLTLLTL